MPNVAPATETKFVASKMNFVTDKTVAKKSDDLALEVATEWCKENDEWEYTGTWKNERSEENEATEVSHFQVRKKASAQADATDSGEVKPVIVMEDSKIDESGKRPAVIDQK